MHESANDPKRNQLLAALPESEWKRWSSELEYVEMKLGEVLVVYALVPEDLAYREKLYGIAGSVKLIVCLII